MSHWRNTYKPARFIMMDARSGVPLLVALLHITPTTVGVAAATIAAFWFLERLGMDFPAALRALRSMAVGKHRPARRAGKIRWKTDYDARPLR